MYLPAQRRDYIERFVSSGVSQAEFCRRAKIHPATFSQWRRAMTPATPVFAEVQVSAPLPTVIGGPAVLHLPGGARLEVAVECAAAWHGLGVLLNSLQSDRRP